MNLDLNVKIEDIVMYGLHSGVLSLSQAKEQLLNERTEKEAVDVLIKYLD